MSNLRTRHQGKAIVERDPEGILMVMLPDGDIIRCDYKSDVVRYVKNWASKDLKHKRADMGIVQLEWRDGSFDAEYAPPSRVVAVKGAP